MVGSGVNHSHGFSPVHHESSSMTQTLEDIIIYVAMFLSYRDLCTLGCVCRRYEPLPAYDPLWEQHALAIVRSPQQLRTVVSALNLSSNRQVVEIFKRIGIPRGVLGLWRADGPIRSWSVKQELLGTLLPQQGPTAVESARAQGELLRLSLVAGGFLCESIDPNGSSHCVFAIRASTTPEGKIKLGFFSLEDDSLSTTGGYGWKPGQSILEAFLERTSAIPSGKGRTPIRPAGDSSFLLCRSGGHTQRYSMIEPPPPYHPLASLCTGQGLSGRVANARVLSGLWCAPYASHGFEIIHISLDPPPQEADVSGLVAGIEGASGSTKVRRRSSTGSSCSSGKTTFGESTCTSEPATDSSDSGSGESCSSMESDDSCEEEEEGREKSTTDTPRTHTMVASPGYRGGSGGGGTSGRDDFDDLSGSDDDDNGDAMVIDSVYDTRSSNDDQSAAPFLYGVKVTGDVNVPAGKVSFAVDLGKGCDPVEELEADSRPVILFLPTGPVMANLANRGNQIAFWCKGRGRINRTPGRWVPDSVDVDFIVYRPGSRRGFSVIFRQQTHVLRLIMDFERALSSSEEWPRWSLV